MAKTKKRRCSYCGKLHDPLLTDIASQLPDAVWKLDYRQRYLRARYNRDFCTLDERGFFIRCVLPIDLQNQRGFFGWGLWVEVTKKDHDRLLRDFQRNTKNQAPFKGKLANDLKIYGRTLGLEIVGKPCAEHRPLLYMPEPSTHSLAIEQRAGINTKRHHEIVERYA